MSLSLSLGGTAPSYHKRPDHLANQDTLLYDSGGTKGLKVALLICLNLLIAGAAMAQEERPNWINKGQWELGIWSGGGTAFGQRDTQFLTSGFRAAKTLTSKIQYAFEVIPLFVVFQNDTVYGADITPFLLKWNFTGTSSRVFPYIVGGAGALFTGSDVPEGTSRLNFTPQIGFGLHFSLDKRAFAIEGRFVHISNGGFESPNPGINTLQLNIGYSWVN